MSQYSGREYSVEDVISAIMGMHRATPVRVGNEKVLISSIDVSGECVVIDADLGDYVHVDEVSELLSEVLDSITSRRARDLIETFQARWGIE